MRRRTRGPTHRASRSGSTNKRMRPIVFVMAAAVSLICWATWRYNTRLAPHADRKAEEPRAGPPEVAASELRKWYAMSDEDVLQATQDDVRRSISWGEDMDAQGSFPQTYGLSRGPYSKISPHSRLLKIAGVSNSAEVAGMRFACNFDVFTFRNSNSTPPDAPPHSSLLLPGMLSHRPQLPNTALCFLFYTELLWTRATGGAKGVTLARVVGGDNRIGDKEVLAECLAEYRERHGCNAPGVGNSVVGYPETVLLKDKYVCEKFFQANHLWAHEEEDIWFLKDAQGSLGRHIQLLRRMDVSAMAANGSYSCPMPGRVASLEVPNMWIPGERKFDQRFYVLIPSLDPLIILIRRGYLRFSTFRYTRDKVEGEDSELDRMRHVTNLAIQLYDVSMLANSSARKAGGHEDEALADIKTGGHEVLQPPSRLRDELMLHLGPEEGQRAHRRLERSARDSILQVMYALRRKLAPWDMAQKNVSQTWALLSMDVAYDTANNAYVLDLNARPAPTGTKHPSWYLEDRSATIREAVDILQEVSFRHLVKTHNKSHVEWPPLKNTHGWELLFHEALGGVQDSTLLRPGLKSTTNNQIVLKGTIRYSHHNGYAATLGSTWRRLGDTKSPNTAILDNRALVAAISKRASRDGTVTFGEWDFFELRIQGVQDKHCVCANDGTYFAPVPVPWPGPAPVPLASVSDSLDVSLNAHDQA